MFKGCFCRKRSEIACVIASIMVIGGLLLVIVFMPLWMWISLLGWAMVASGVLIFKKCK